MAKHIDKRTFEIPSRKVTIERVPTNGFDYIQEVFVDYNTARLLVEKGKPVYRKEIETSNGTIKQLFFVKVSSRHYMEFLEINSLGI